MTSSTKQFINELKIKIKELEERISFLEEHFRDGLDISGSQIGVKDTIAGIRRAVTNLESAIESVTKPSS